MSEPFGGYEGCAERMSLNIIHIKLHLDILSSLFKDYAVSADRDVRATRVT